MDNDREIFGSLSDPTDWEIVTEVLKSNRELFETLLRRYNARVYRVARSIIGDDAEAEDVAQETWVHAYANLAQYAGAASFSTWISKIAAHEALLRRRRRARISALPRELDLSSAPLWAGHPGGHNPEKRAFESELRRVLEGALDALPAQYRSVFVLRCIEHLSVSETADVLGVSEQAVKARLHRARVILRRLVGSQLGQFPPDLYNFPAPRCDRVAGTVRRRLALAARTNGIAGLATRR